ncbi:MAG: HDOD domain-containing protein, partial [Nitrospinota bacterium]
MDKLVMQQMLHRLEELPPLPTVAMTLLHKTLDTDGALEEITALVEVDQALALKVLALANSPVFRRYRKITSIKEAILLLGLNMLKSLVLSISVLDTLRFAQESWFPYGQHWKHSLACAFYAKNLGQRVERNLAEEAFVTGVLHDIGKVVLALCFPQEYQEVLGGAMSTASPLHQAERERFGFDHAMVGRWTLERWKLPPQLQEPIWLHHHALSALLQKPEPSYRLAAITALADRLCYTQGFAGINQGEPLPEQWWELFSLQAWEKEAILDGVQESVDQLSQPLRRKTFQRESSTRVLQRMTKELGKLHLSAEEERQRLQEKLSQLSLLREMGMALQNASSQVEVLEILGEYVLKGLQCRSVCCGLYLEEGRILEVEVRANGMGGIQKTSRIRSREEQAAQQPAGGNGGEMRLE